MSNSRSRKVRKLMAETGMNYTKTSLELERREAAQDVPTSEGFSLHSDLTSAGTTRGIHEDLLAQATEAADRFTASLLPPDLPSTISAAAGIHENVLAQATEAADRFTASFLPPDLPSAITEAADRFTASLLPPDLPSAISAAAGIHENVLAQATEAADPFTASFLPPDLPSAITEAADRFTPSFLPPFEDDEG